MIFSYLSLHFYAHNVKIVLKKTDRVKNPLTKQIIVKSLKGPAACRYCIAPWKWCILISSSGIKFADLIYWKVCTHFVFRS